MDEKMSESRKKRIAPMTLKIQMPQEQQKKSVKSFNPWESVIQTMGKMGVVWK
jgi:hypothetical protein